MHDDYDYNSNNFEGDIALVVLEESVDLKPMAVGIVCLPPVSSTTILAQGIVVGWGVSEESEANHQPHSSTPKEVQLPVVTDDACFAADVRFRAFKSSRSFCAGFVNQSKAACLGDSGGGFYSHRDGRLYLAGIVSSSLPDPYGDCRSDTYSVFTDVRMFVGWIRNKMEETKVIKWKSVKFECSR
jgi:secreted trypsin-like serine protease